MRGVREVAGPSRASAGAERGPGVNA